jgi:hypothetical protein
LVKEAEVDPIPKNKYGYNPSDIAQNFQIRQLFENILPHLYKVKQPEEQKGFYGRTVFNGVLYHNDRVNSV